MDFRKFKLINILCRNRRFNSHLLNISMEVNKASNEGLTSTAVEHFIILQFAMTKSGEIFLGVGKTLY